MDYKQFVTLNTVAAEETDIKDGTEFLKLEDATVLLDDIEYRVNIICDLLSKITGLTEIEEIKELAGKLSNDLY